MSVLVGIWLLAPSPHRDTIQRPLPLEPREGALNRLALLLDRLPLRRAVQASVAWRNLGMAFGCSGDHPLRFVASPERLN